MEYQKKMRSSKYNILSIHIVRFEVTVFCNVTHCSLTDVYICSFKNVCKYVPNSRDRIAENTNLQ
jgi:hypothetical protein